MPITVNCEICHKEVKRKPSHVFNHVYCSRECSVGGMRNKFLEKKKTVCKQCGKVFYTKQRTTRKKQQFCNQACMGASFATLDYSISHTDQVIEDLDGFMLGDGYISPDSSHLSWGVKYKDFSDYISNAFYCYSTSTKKSFRKDKRSPKGGNWTHAGRSKTHPDLKEQRKRWYPNGIKKVPKDVVITSKSENHRACPVDEARQGFPRENLV